MGHFREIGDGDAVFSSVIEPDPGAAIDLSFDDPERTVHEAHELGLAPVRVDDLAPAGIKCGSFPVVVAQPKDLRPDGESPISDRPLPRLCAWPRSLP